MNASYQDFLEKNVPECLSKLTPESKPLWGNMDAQNMVEHLSLTLTLSNGIMPIVCSRDPQKVAVSMEFLRSNQIMPRGFRGPGLPQEPIPHINPNLAAAAQLLREHIALFFTFFQANPTAAFDHPVFGSLGFELWQRFHCKHFVHHFTQFALLPEQNTFDL